MAGDWNVRLDVRETDYVVLIMRRLRFMEWLIEDFVLA